MKIVFVSNFFTHHQKPLSDFIYAQEGTEYTFVATSEMTDECKKTGYAFGNEPEYVKFSYKDEKSFEECLELIDQADVVIAGSAPEKMLKNRIKSGKILVRYSERPLKKGNEVLKFVPRFVKWNLRNPKNRPVYMLCSSAYTAADYAKFGLFKRKTYKWGYFPVVKEENVERLMEEKEKNSLTWVARVIDWKHPEIPVEIAKRLKKDGYSFEIKLIGTGVMEDEIQKKIEDENLSDCVKMLGSMPPERVREHMEKSEILMFTSDFNEGWGAVLNEAMNSGCAVVASHAIGSVPFVVTDGEDGVVYKNGDMDDLYKKVKWLLDNPEERKRIGRSAYWTMVDAWAPEIAGRRLLKLLEDLTKSGECDFFESGPCSRAEILKNDWYR
ncbi:MAG: glycosyltransferase [Clostridia bacterium]|nr:glycosyltransferase [Clostridia bacterium]